MGTIAQLRAFTNAPEILFFIFNFSLSITLKTLFSHFHRIIEEVKTNEKNALNH